MLDFRPDLPWDTPGMVTAVADMMPTAKGYKTYFYPAAAIGGATLTLGASESHINTLYATQWLSQPGGILIGGTNKALYVITSGGSYIDVSKSGGYALAGSTYQYGQDAAAAFDICSFGDVLIAAHKSIVPQYRSALDLTVSTLFANLGTTSTPPKASVCATASNFLFLGDLNSTWGTVISTAGTRDMVAWSAIGDHQNWNNDPTGNQSSFQQFVDTPGPITALAPLGDAIVVFKANAMYLGRYVGAGSNSPIWAFERISGQIGCLGPRSVVDIGGRLVFAGIDDVYIFDGSRPQSITAGIRETHITGKTNFGGVTPMRLAHDRPNGCVYIASAFANGLLVWSYKYDKWGQLGVTGNGSSTPGGLSSTDATYIAFCKTNVDDFRSITATTFGGSASNNHQNLYSLFAFPAAASGGNPTTCGLWNRLSGGNYSTSASLTTGSFGNEIKLTKFVRLTPKMHLSSAGSVASCVFYTGRHANNLSSVTAPATVSAGATDTFRFDLLTGAAAANWAQFKITFGQGAGEIVDVIVDGSPAGTI